MFDHRAAVTRARGDRLGLGLAKMGLEAQARFARQARCGDQEFVAGMQRDRRRDARAHHRAVMRPSLDRLAHGREADIERLHRHRGGFGFMRLRDRIEQRGEGLEQRAVGQHRCHDRAHAGIGIGLAHRVRAFDRRGRNLDEQVERGRAAAPDHLDRRQGRGDVFVLQRARSVDRPVAVQEQLQRDTIGDGPAPQPAMRVGVRVDQSGDQQSIGGVERFGRRRVDVGANSSDHAVDDQNVGVRRLSGFGIENAPAGDFQRARSGHGLVLSWSDTPARARRAAAGKSG